MNRVDAFNRWIRDTWAHLLERGGGLLREYQPLILVSSSVIFCASLALTVYWLSTPVPTPLRATVRTRSLSFVIGESPKSAGIFNSDTALVDLTLTVPANLVSEDATARACQPNTILRSVSLTRLILPEQLRVALDAEPNGIVHYTLSSPPPPGSSLPSVPSAAAGNLNAGETDPSFLVLVRDFKERRNPSSVLVCTPMGTLTAGEWTIVPSYPRASLEFTVDFDLHSLKASRRGAALIGPAPEFNIALADKSSLKLEGDASLATEGNQLRLTDSGHTDAQIDGLELKNLRNASIEKLSYDARSSAFVVSIVGAAFQVSTKIGDTDVERAESRFSFYRPHGVGARFSTIVTIVSGLVTIFGAPFTAHKRNRRAK